MLNRVVLVGRLTRDPDLRYTPTGVAVANFTLAVGRPFTNQEGNRETDFINCVVWRRPAENLANYMKKGSLVGVDGRLQSRTYEGNDGKTVYVTEVVADSVQFLEPKSATQGGSQSSGGSQYDQGNNKNQNEYQNKKPSQSQNQQESQSNPFQNDGEPIDISDDDLPF